MPLFYKEMFYHLRQTGQHLGETLLVSVLFDDVEEPVVEMFSVGIFEHFRDEDVISWISVEHIDGYSRVQCSRLE